MTAQIKATVDSLVLMDIGTLSFALFI